MWMRVMLHTSTHWERHHGLGCMVNRRMFHCFVHSDAGRLCTSTQTEEIRESTLPVPSWRSTSGLSPTPAHGHFSFQRRMCYGLRTRRSLMNIRSLFARQQSLTSSVRSVQLMSCIKSHIQSSGSLRISCMSANIQGCTTIQQVI